MSKKHLKLDNPVWYSLAETHEKFAVEYGDVQFYQPIYCPFGGFVNLEQTAKSIEQYAALTNNFYVVGEKPRFGQQLHLKRDLVCRQMILNQSISVAISEEIIELRTATQKEELSALVNLVQPGFFRSKTAVLGTYFGIYKNGELVAVTGERMKMHQYTEISAVVNHPNHRGKGYATQLIAHTANKIFSENKLPYLHVSAINRGAIRLYEKLGFETRRLISFWNLEVV